VGSSCSRPHAVMDDTSCCRSKIRGFGPAALVLALTACGIDERELQPASGSTTGGTAAGSSGVAGSTNSTGGRPPGLDAPPPPEDCSYVGSAVPEGCETVVSNPGFDKSFMGWAPEMITILLGWNNTDALASDDSGTLIVENTQFSEDSKFPGEFILGARQCIPAEENTVYDVMADVFIPEQATRGRAGVSVYFYKTPDCNAGMGGTDLSFTSELFNEQGEWLAAGGRFVVPAGVQSMEVRLLAAKTFPERSFQVLFDNVLVQEK
jgi:hypothetical protein